MPWPHLLLGSIVIAIFSTALVEAIFWAVGEAVEHFTQ